MIYYAALSGDLCTGVQSSNGHIPSLIDITAEVQSGTPISDFLWRKWENGQWSTEKFEPVPPDPGPDLPTEISKLKEENENLKQRFAQMDGDFFGFQQFYFEKNPQDA